MTTTVVVKANHGWPVDVQQIHPKTAEPISPISRVPKDTERTFCIHATADLRIHEVQPDELAAEAASTQATEA